MNECLLPSHNCDVNAYCNNTIGSYTCTCKPGYTGDGRTCTDDDECSLNTNNCSVNADCSNTQGSYVCACKSGYTGDGRTCSDIDECNTGTDNCHTNATCSNINGSFTCKCNTGYQGDGVICLQSATLLTSYEDHQVTTFTDGVGACVPIQQFSCPVKVGDEYRTRMHVCSNGFVTFNGKYLANSIPKSVLDRKAFAKKAVVAPYFSHIDINRGGKVYHRVYSAQEYANNSVLQGALSPLLEEAGYGGTDVYLVIVVTWKDVVEYAKSVKNNSTFQLVIVADGQSTTLAFFSYLEDNMRFTTDENLIGFATDLLAEYNIRVENPTSEYLNLGRRGLVWYFLNTGLDDTISPCMTCRIWATSEKSDLSRLKPAWDLIPECPCDVSTITRTGFFDRFSSSYFPSGLRCYDFRSSSWYKRQGSVCCYKGMAYASQSPQVGFKTRYSQQLQLFLELEVYMKDVCCGAGLCDVFYSVRPPNSGCSANAAVSFGGGMGDPHFLTPDGKEFTFNGHGEYKMMELTTDTGISFKLQSRAEPYLNTDGISVGATVFTAFAARETLNGMVSSFTIELDSATRTGLQINVNGRTWTNEFNTESNFSRSLENVYISKPRANTIDVIFLNSGFKVEIEEKTQLLLMSVTVPNRYTGMSKGLLGNVNGKSDDDLMFANGTILATNATEREIFPYGQTWIVSSDSDSVFRYKPGATYANYRNISFIPNFLDEADIDKVNASKALCGSDNRPCIYDKVFTGSDAVATNTKSFVQETDETKAALANLAPTVVLKDDVINQTTGKVHAYVNESIVLYFIGEDDGTAVTYDVLNGSDVLTLQGGATDKNRSATLRFQTVIPTTVSVTVTDSRNVSAVYDIPVILCTGCSGHGNCSFTETRDSSQVTGGTSLAVCYCDAYHTGLDCELDYDGCADAPCSYNRSCSDNNVTTHQNTDKAYTCGPCPDGYLKDDVSEDCFDIDECNGTSPCSDICTNTIGSYECSCRTGRRTLNITHCIDINECAEGTHNCDQRCNNTDGGFQCACFSGFNYNSTSNVCEPDNITLCASLSCDTDRGGCFVENGTPKCFCKSGYTLVNDTSCQDVDECSQNVCSQGCTNSPGSFSCSCYTGYLLNVDKTTCSGCPTGFWGSNCSSVCGCSSQGSDRCDNIKGCVCKPGWEGPRCTVNKNECSAANICGDNLKTCVDTVGSYKCVCKQGYRLNTNTDKCEDLNECNDPNLNTCQQTCVNTVGGFSCSCLRGYKKNTTDATKCIDIDECKVGGSGCAQICENAEGSYNCLCYFGYELNDDQMTCTEISDEDLCLRHGLNCSGYCAVTTISAKCACGEGYVLAADDLQSCIDVNECDNATLNGCDVPTSCKNTPGGYTCSCPIGHFLDNDGVTCTVCDAFHYGVNCAMECNCSVGADRCDPVSGCVCQAGWNGPKCDNDKDECNAATSPCVGSNKECVNTPGSYTCQCLTGFKNYTDGNCTNINECSDDQLNDCQQDCTDTEGSYTCSCRSGYRQSGKTCLDINECNGVHDCSQVCVNTDGGYVCSCEPGFELNVTDKTSCIPEAECTSSCGNNSFCVQNTCRCNTGFEKLNENDTDCTDVDECTVENRCVNGNCTNVPGGFMCTCGVGFKLDSDLVTCVECESGKYGVECRNNCACNTSNTDSCDATNGACACKEGWEGSMCQTDKDECKIGTAECISNSTCINTQGSFVCECDDGFTKTADGSCQECDSNRYGKDCAYTCKCVSANTLSCDSVDSACYCREGWNGTACSEDVDECKNNSICWELHKSVCDNINGSYRCLCDSGYELNTADECSDTDECQRGTSNCTQKCTNTDGSFNCSCHAGFSGDGYNCTACQNWTFGEQCTNTCTCNVSNTANCNAKDGSCECNTGWQGENCTEDMDECEATSFDCPDNSTCNNTVGSYECYCIPGFNMTDDICEACQNWTYGEQCANTCTCEVSNTAVCNAVNGSCECNTGWQGENCTEDMDECDSNSFDCPDNSTCNNTVGSYECNCIPGFNMTDDICEACQNWTFGEQCARECTCNVSNTAKCNAINGSCECNTGWQGENCTEDMDECEAKSFNCPDNSTCNNTVGSYECYCIPGFNMTDNICEACQNNTYGDDCRSSCNCTREHTLDPSQSCDHINGTCFCTQYWKGDSCDTDVNECSETANVCNDPNEGCQNEIGNFSCLCLRGYVRNENGTCVQEPTTTTTPRGEEFASVSVELTLQINITENLKTSDIYKKYEKEVQTRIRSLYESKLRGTDFEIIITDLRNGSLIVSYIIVVVKSKLDEVAIANLQISTSKDVVVIFDVNATTTSISVNGKIVANDTSLCDVFELLVEGGCPLDHVCTIVDGKPVCLLPDDNFSLVVGLAVGIPVGCIILLIAAICVIQRKLRTQRKSRNFISVDRSSDNISSIFAEYGMAKRIRPGYLQDPVQPQPNSRENLGQSFSWEDPSIPDFYSDRTRENTQQMEEQLSPTSLNAWLEPFPTEQVPHSIPRPKVSERPQFF